MGSVIDLTELKLSQSALEDSWEQDVLKGSGRKRSVLSSAQAIVIDDELSIDFEDVKESPDKKARFSDASDNDSEPSFFLDASIDPNHSGTTTHSSSTFPEIYDITSSQPEPLNASEKHPRVPFLNISPIKPENSVDRPMYIGEWEDDDVIPVSPSFKYETVAHTTSVTKTEQTNESRDRVHAKSEADARQFHDIAHARTPAVMTNTTTSTTTSTMIDGHHNIEAEAPRASTLKCESNSNSNTNGVKSEASLNAPQSDTNARNFKPEMNAFATKPEPVVPAPIKKQEPDTQPDDAAARVPINQAPDVQPPPAAATAPPSSQAPPAKLSPEQQAVLDAVMLGKSIFLTGCGGTGKSFLIEMLVKAARARGKRVAVTATTGIASVNIGGITIHSWGGIGTGEDTVDKLVGRIMKNNDKKQRWIDIELLIIDEISMLDGRLFDKLEEIARRVRGRASRPDSLSGALHSGLLPVQPKPTPKKNYETPFGGIQLVLCGDFFQLPPVPKKGIEAEGKFCFESEQWSGCVQEIFELKTIFRQKDGPFIEMLTEIRQGRCSAETRRILQNCLAQRAEPYSDNIEPTKLFATKKDVALVNTNRLKNLAGEVQTYRARNSINFVNESEIVRERAHQYMEQLENNCPCEAELSIKVGAQVVLIKNLEPESGLVNGSLGVITSFVNAGDVGKCFPLVKFLNGKELTIQPDSWSIEDDDVIVTRTQVPLKLAWALTIHKCQGMTLDRAAINLGPSVFAQGQAYVALSRVKTLKGIRLLEFHTGAIKAHAKVHAFYKSLENNGGKENADVNRPEANFDDEDGWAEQALNARVANRPRPAPHTDNTPLKSVPLQPRPGFGMSSSRDNARASNQSETSRSFTTNGSLNTSSDYVDVSSFPYNPPTNTNQPNASRFNSNQAPTPNPYIHTAKNAASNHGQQNSGHSTNVASTSKPAYKPASANTPATNFGGNFSIGMDHFIDRPAPPPDFTTPSRNSSSFRQPQPPLTYQHSPPGANIPERENARNHFRADFNDTANQAPSRPTNETDAGPKPVNKSPILQNIQELLNTILEKQNEVLSREPSEFTTDDIKFEFKELMKTTKEEIYDHIESVKEEIKDELKREMQTMTDSLMAAILQQQSNG